MHRKLPAEMMLDCAVNPGDSLLHVQPGGGGYGDPFTRDEQRVLDDVLDGKISVAYASEHYGVVMQACGRQVDHVATAAARGSR